MPELPGFRYWTMEEFSWFSLSDVVVCETEAWQQWDIETDKQFELCEILMEHYILKGRGPSVYYNDEE